MDLRLPDTLSLLTLLVVVGLAPFAAVLVTSFAKIVIVLSLLRAALGVQQTPPNMVLNALALIVSAYIMAPVGMDIADNLRQKPATGIGNRPQELGHVLDAARKPLAEFLGKHSSPRERRFFLETSRTLWPKDKAERLTENDLIILIPSFTLTELTEAFQVGFLLYLLFVVVDLIVANILLAWGMAMLSPTLISVPFKLLLFVMLDGWSALLHGLVLSYR
jgi:type III secretion protein R